MPRLGMCASMIGIASAIWVMWLSVDLARQAQLALMVPTDCGTGRHAAEGQLMFSAPLALLIPTGAWVVSRIAGYAQLLSRCALWSAILGWILSVVFVVFRHSL
jgi:hypothetical protein